MTRDYDQILDSFDRRCRMKKMVNLLLCAVIIILGISSVLFIWNHDQEGILTFRWMTVDGTIYTTVMTMFILAVNVVELEEQTELTERHVYFARLSSAVAECLILVVALLSQLPFFSEHMHLTRYDMFCMHVMIPLLTVISFAINDPPVGPLKLREIFIGTDFVTVYAAVIIPLIAANVITDEYIPYFFLDVRNMKMPYVAGCFAVIYGIAFLISYCLYRLNRKLYWGWFRHLWGDSQKNRNDHDSHSRENDLC